MGPNARYVAGAYWDFWDHYLPLTERSLGEALENRNFQILRAHSRFLPYTMLGKKPAPIFLIKAYLKMPIFLSIFSVERKPSTPSTRRWGKST